MKYYLSGREIELEGPTRTIGQVMILASLGLVLFAESAPDATQRVHLYNLMLLFTGVGLFTIFFYGVAPVGASRFLVLATGLLIIVAGLWLGYGGVFILLVLPVVMAATLFGLRAMILTAGVCSACLFMLRFTNPVTIEPVVLWLSLVAMWGVAGMLYSVQLQVAGLLTWAINYWDRAEELSKQTQENRLELERALQNLSNANQLLLQANKRADRLRAVAENAEKTKSMFVARVSHEFRTPLNMIIGLVELMVDAPQIYALRMPPELQKDLEVVLRNCRHLSTLIDDVLELTRAESGSLTLHRGWVNLVDIIKEALLVVSPLIAKKGLLLETSIPEDLPGVYCDRTRMRQVLLNLVSNAARYTDHGRIEIKVELSGDMLVTSVTDTGPGISAENAERIFEPFCQGESENSWRDKGGSGLGLTISKQFVELHGGQMWLKSQPGQGSTFFFTLPIRTRGDFPASPHRWIQPDWVWHEDSFKAARIEDAGRQARPHVVAYDTTGGLLPDLERYGEPFNLVEAKSLDELTSYLMTRQVDLVWINTKNASRFSALLAEINATNPGAPVIGTAFTAPKIPGDSNHVRYLTKPVSLEKLRQALADYGPSLRRVLVVDDDMDVRHLFQKMLKVYNPQLELRCVSSGEEALDALGEEMADLAILDVVLPGISGWELLDILRKTARTRDLPVLFVSAQDLSNRSPLSSLFLVSSSEGYTLKRLLACSLRMLNLTNVTGEGGAMQSAVHLQTSGG